MKNIIIKPLSWFIVALTVIGFNSCETTELDLLDSPNAVTPDNADPTLLLNNIQLSYVNFLNGYEPFPGLNPYAMEMSRMEHLFGAYTGTFAANSSVWNSAWRDAYRETLQDIRVLLPIAEERNLSFHIGMAKLIEAHTLVSLVDFFGNVPYSEAFQGDLNPNPVADEGSELYEVAFTLIDEAIVALEDESSPVPTDLFYDGNRDAWIAWGNTLRLKMYNTIRLVEPDRATNAITSLVNNADLITENSEDYVFAYSTSGTPAESRHPEFVENYGPAGAQDYMSNYFMYIMKDEKAITDPRLRYYFYRQTLNAPTGSNRPCQGDPDYDFCYIGGGYWGRDHADDSGVPSDASLRTTWGVYPAGGNFDDGSGNTVTFSSGAEGAGIFPIWLSSFTYFTLAETALTLGTPGEPAGLLEQAIRESFNKVLAFGPMDSDHFTEELAATQEEVDTYVTLVLEAYEEAQTEDEKLSIIMKEYLIAAWGNGLEPYNNLRRTGLPFDIQSPVKSAGPFPRSVLYPLNYIDLNANSEVKPVTVQVFWDNNPDNFID